MKNKKVIINILAISIMAILLVMSGLLFYKQYTVKCPTCKECQQCEECETCEEVTDNYHSWCKDDNNCYEQIIGKKFYQILDEKASKNNAQSTLELNNDNTFEMTVNKCEYIITLEGTFTVTEDKLALTYNGNRSDIEKGTIINFNIVSGDKVILSSTTPELITCEPNNDAIFITKSMMDSLLEDFTD